MENSKNNQNSKINLKNLKRFFSAKTILVLLIAIIFARMVYWNLGFRETRASDLSLENIIVAINSERTLRNLATLKEDNRLSFAAQSKAEDMQNRHYFSHTDPDGNYIWPKIVEAGYSPYLQLGENLAIEFYNTESLISAWMNSPTHRANVLNEGFKDQGMGLEFGNSSQGKYHSAIVNTFGTLVAKKVITQKQPEPQKLPTPPPPIPQTIPAATPPKETPPKEIAPPTSTPPTETNKPTYLASSSLNEPNLPLVTIEQKPNYITPQKENFPKAGTGTSTLEIPIKEKLKDEQKSEKDDQNTKRYLSITLVVLLILFVVSDIKETVEQKLQGLDKKINNLVLLVLALVVIAFLYWL